MKKRTAEELRQLFLDFYARHQHTVVKSSPLIPANDPTLMFTNAGMVPFKDVFTGAETRTYTRATSSQKCLRVSGKHNDLEAVGRTARHHTFFEMLGNFSFGDYFKRDAIELAWRFLIEEVGLPSDKLWITVFGGENGIEADDEARAIWKEVTGFSDERIIGMGMKDNFWSMGETGPCGPCTEIHYDTGDGSIPTADDFENGRIVEIWNNVFMQFVRHSDGHTEPLPAPSVDTGMGLERLVTVVQGETSNYHTDLFMPLLETTANALGKTYERSDSEDDVSMRVIADHARCTAFLVADGVQPSNEGRGYVMRRIMRRAIRHGRRLGFDKLFFHTVCDVVVERMSKAYPELLDARVLIQKVAELEERTFRRTLDTGLGILGKELDALSADSATELPGEAVFKLCDTYGFPTDLTEVIAAERGFSIDLPGFERAMEAQRTRSRAGAVGDKAVTQAYHQLREELQTPGFVGYPDEGIAPGERTEPWRVLEQDGMSTLQTQTKVTAILVNGERAETTPTSSCQSLELMLDPTPFYGESGGQVGDVGVVMADDGSRFEVESSIKPLEDLTLSRGVMQAGQFKVGDTLWAGYEITRRRAIRAHHSATHLLHGSLRDVLGEHVKQAGSYVGPERLRFDYSHFEAPTAALLNQVEEAANAQVGARSSVQTEVLPFDDARERGAIALFGEKYGDSVRVVSMGPSVELCGGTHVHNTSDIGMILITKEEGVAAGVRRIEAEVGESARATIRKLAGALHAASDLFENDDGQQPGDPIVQAVAKTVRSHRALLEELRSAGGEAVDPSCRPRPIVLDDDFDLSTARRLRDMWNGLVKLTNTRGADAVAVAETYAAIDSESLLATLAAYQQALRDNEKSLAKERSKALTANADDLLAGIETIGGVSVLATAVQGVAGKAMRELADQLRNKMNSGVLCIVSDNGGKAGLLIAVTSDLTDRFKAGSLIKELAPLIGGRGGGRPELAQAGGDKPAGAPEAFDRLRALLQA